MDTALIGSRQLRCGWLAALSLTCTLGAQATPGKTTPVTKIATTIPDLAFVAEQIGGERVAVDSLTAGHEDMHLVRIRPSLLIKVRRADAFIQLGLDAEHSWVPALLRNARNSAIAPGAAGFCDASTGIAPLEIPESTSRGDGPDVHPGGNPHYNLDPTRMGIVARNIRDCLVRLDPDHREHFDRRLAAFEKRLDERLKSWREQLEPLRGATFVEAHSAWVYFADAFDLKIVAKLEPKPGLAPTPSHLVEVIETAKSRDVGLVVGQPRFADVARKVAEAADAHVALLDLGCSTDGPHQDWFGFMDHVVETFATHLRASPRPQPGR